MTDKLLISVLRSINPNLFVTVIVRGKPVTNDATMEDARQVGMCEAFMQRFHVPQFTGVMTREGYPDLETTASDVRLL